MLGLGSYISDSEGDRFDLSDVSGLVGWLQSGVGFGTVSGDGSIGSSVGTWYDRAAESNWTQGESGQRPTIAANGGLDFDGADDALDRGTQASLTTFHFFMVIDIEGASNETVIGVNGSSNYLRFFKGGSTDTMRYSFGSSSPTVINPTTSSNIPTTKFLFEYLNKLA